MAAFCRHRCRSLGWRVASNISAACSHGWIKRCHTSSKQPLQSTVLLLSCRCVLSTAARSPLPPRRSPPCLPHSTTVFSHSQTVVVCPSCNTVLCVPTGGKARLTEGEQLAARRRGRGRVGHMLHCGDGAGGRQVAGSTCVRGAVARMRAAAGADLGSSSTASCYSTAAACFGHQQRRPAGASERCAPNAVAGVPAWVSLLLLPFLLLLLLISMPLRSPSPQAAPSAGRATKPPFSAVLALGGGYCDVHGQPVAAALALLSCWDGATPCTGVRGD